MFSSRANKVSRRSRIVNCPGRGIPAWRNEHEIEIEREGKCHDNRQGMTLDRRVLVCYEVRMGWPKGWGWREIFDFSPNVHISPWFSGNRIDWLFIEEWRNRTALSMSFWQCYVTYLQVRMFDACVHVSYQEWFCSWLYVKATSILIFFSSNSTPQNSESLNLRQSRVSSEFHESVLYHRTGENHDIFAKTEKLGKLKLGIERVEAHELLLWNLDLHDLLPSETLIIATNGLITSDLALLLGASDLN